MDEEIKILADKLYFDLPFWKRRSVAKWYKRNNRDVLGVYTECMNQAMRMCQERKSFLDRLRK